jgi:sigma-E factor negative regulatory protein RseB
MLLQLPRLLPSFALFLTLLPLAVSAGPEAPGAAGQGLDACARLSRIHAAASSGNYQGTMVFSAGGTMSSSRVWHYAVGDQTFEQLEALDGRQQRIARHNDTVQTVWPQSRTAVLEKRETLSLWSTTPQAVDPQALEQYELRREADGRVAGREAAVFLLEPRDGLRYAQRLWADLATGLMLRADVIAVGAAGSGRPVLESTAFSEVAIGVKPQPELVTQSLQGLRKLEGYRVVRPQQLRTSLDAEGWALVNPVAGFRLAGCVRRGMDATGDQEPVLQAVFSDGLTHVSLFVEAYRAQRHRSELLARHGATATFTQRRGEHWIAAVGDVPPDTLKRFAAALDRKRP